MRYKMQFTVCNDDVKQDRKLPTISFFDTDGNPIDLGAGVGGGSVDLTHLTELGFGSESDVALERVESNDDPYLRVHGHGDSYQWSQIASESWDVTLSDIVYQAALYADEAGYAGAYFRAAPDLTIIQSTIIDDGVVESDNRFIIDSSGKIQWGNGSVAPDTYLKRVSPGALQLIASSDRSETDFLVTSPSNTDQIYLGAYDGGSYLQLTGDASLDLGNAQFIYGDSPQWGPGYPVLSVTGLQDGEIDFVNTSIAAVAADGAYYSVMNKFGLTIAGADTNPILFVIPHGYSESPFNINGLGKIQWGAGTGLPDVSLQRIAPGHLNIPGGQEVGLIVGDPSGAYFGMYGNGYTEGYAEAADNWIHTVQIVGEAGTRAAWRADGQLQWGDGTAAPDTHLARVGPGDMVLGDHALTGPGIELTANDAAASLYLQNDGTSDNWLYLDPGSLVGLELAKAGSGIKLHSPDGSQTKRLRLSNAGALELV